MLDASGLIHIQGDNFLVAEDEVDQLRVFLFDKQALTFQDTGVMPDFGEQESDFESIARAPRTGTYYCIGSYSADYSKVLISFQLPGLQVSQVREIPFDPSLLVERELNIESLSSQGGNLLVGLRSPSIGQRAVMLLFNPGSSAQLLITLDLEGRVFRDMDRVDDHNYLILAGPERGRDYRKLPARIFWWNGDLMQPKLRKCQVNLDGYRAEGLGVRLGRQGELEVLVGTDESKTPKANSFRMLYIAASSLEELCSQRSTPEELVVVLSG